MQMRTTITHDLTPTRLAEIREADDIQHCGQSPHGAGGSVVVNTHLVRLSRPRACDPAALLLRRDPEKAFPTKRTLEGSTFPSRGEGSRGLWQHSPCHMGPVRCVGQSHAQAHGGSCK